MNFVSRFCVLMGSVVILLDLFDSQVTALVTIYKPIMGPDGEMDVRPLEYAKRKLRSCYGLEIIPEKNTLSDFSYMHKTTLCLRAWNLINFGPETDEFCQYYFSATALYDFDVSVTVEDIRDKVDAFGCEITNSSAVERRESTYIYIIGACDRNAMFVAANPEDKDKGPNDKTVPDYVHLYAYLENMDLKANSPSTPYMYRYRPGSSTGARFPGH